MGEGESCERWNNSERQYVQNEVIGIDLGWRRSKADESTIVICAVE